MKDTYGNAEKMARKGGKMVIYESQILGLTLYVIASINSKMPLMINALINIIHASWVAVMIDLLGMACLGLD